MINTMQNMMRESFEKANWLLLEPIMKVEVTTPAEFQENVVTSLTQRNALITTTDSTEGMEYSRYGPTTLEAQERVQAEWRQLHGIADPNEKGKKKKK
ncbi:unnamed protein product [Caenorhabditis brenneri]